MTISWYRRLSCTFALSNDIFYLLTITQPTNRAHLKCAIDSNYQLLNDSAAYVYR